MALHLSHPLSSTSVPKRSGLLHSASALKRSQHTFFKASWSCIKLPLRVQTSCSLKEDASIDGPLTHEGEIQKIEELRSEVRDTNGTLFAHTSHVATARETNGALVESCAESHAATTRIDWIGMSNEEFKRRIQEMAQSPLPRSHLMSEEEFIDFCIRREEMLYQAGKEVSKFYQDVDLPAQLRQLRGKQLSKSDTVSLEQLSKSDTVSLEHGTVARKKDVAKMKSTKKSSLDDFHENIVNGIEKFKTMQGLPRYMINSDKSKLFLPRQEIVAVDTCCMIYYAQAGVEKYDEEAKIVRKLLRLPLEFVFSDLVHLELFHSLSRDKVDLKGVEKRVPGMKKKEARDIHDVRLDKVKEMYEMMDAFHFAQAERGRMVTKNLIDLHSRTQVQPNDGRIMLEVADVASIFCTEDCQHMQPHRCRKGDQMYVVYPWHVFTNKLSTY